MRFVLALILATAGLGPAAAETAVVLRAGAAAVDVSPTKFPVLINGGFLQAQTDRVRDPLFARALVLDDGATRLAIVVVDSCMMPRELLDKAKELAREGSGIAVDHMLISATHTHSAPASMGALGCSVDPTYAAMLPARIAESIEKAAKNLVPAEVGWGAIDAPDHTHCRRWIRKPDTMVVDPFGKATGRAHMHPGYQNPDAIGPSGPVDPQLSVLAARALDGRPLALLANFSMHYFGAPPASADYFGRFAARIAKAIGAPTGGEGPAFVAMMSQGTSGDQQWMDYGAPKSGETLDSFADSLTAKAAEVYESIRFQPGLSLAMEEARLTLRRRVPDEARLAWARPIVEAMGDRPPKSIPEVYAREAFLLHEQPERELKLQAIRVGELGITAIPDEVYAISGLKIKARSPLPSTFNIELANGSEGYIPPPEQHALGGYTTWPARTAALEVQAEPRIVETVVGLLERVSGKPRRVAPLEQPTSYLGASRGLKPWAHWPLDEMDGRRAHDVAGQQRHASLEDGAALYLDGAPLSRPDGHAARTRAVHFAAGRLVAATAPVGERWSVAFWFWNGLPVGERAVCGTLLEAGRPATRLALGGNKAAMGRLALSVGDSSTVVASGGKALATKTWHHVAVVREGVSLQVYLDGEPELKAELPTPLSESKGLSIAGGSMVAERLEGKIDEVGFFDRSLRPSEILDLFRSARTASLDGVGVPASLASRSGR